MMHIFIDNVPKSIRHQIVHQSYITQRALWETVPDIRDNSTVYESILKCSRNNSIIDRNHDRIDGTVFKNKKPDSNKMDENREDEIDDTKSNLYEKRQDRNRLHCNWINNGQYDCVNHMYV
jgi:hypothetical protein